MRFVAAASLQPGMVLARDIISSNRAFILKKGVALNKRYISFLRSKGYLGVYIEDEHSSEIEVGDAISPTIFAGGVYALENGDIDKAVGYAQEIVADIKKQNKTNMDILDLRSYDDYTYHHSVNVAVYAVAVGKRMGLTDEQLVELCQAGLFHDLGKKDIPIEIINKPGKLTDEELRQVRNHPKYSADIVEDNPYIYPGAKEAIVCHHENENGSGYPYGLDGSRTSLITKIIHAVDAYDALISKRPYKEPYSPADAFEYLIGGKDILFNNSVVDTMMDVIPAYPLATEVLLSTGESALIADHTDNNLRPIVKTIKTGKYIDLSDPANKGISIEANVTNKLEFRRAVEILNEDRIGMNTKPADIMLVDDSTASLRQTGEILEEEHYHIIALQSGLAAINYIKEKGAPDLVIMDIEMPWINGITAVTTLRNLGFNDLPVIFLTARGDKDTVMKCMSVKAKDYIVKPVLPAYLKGRVAKALNESWER